VSDPVVPFPYEWRIAESGLVEVRTPAGWSAPVLTAAERPRAQGTWDKWRALFVKHAARTGVPLAWLVAVCTWESGGDPKAESPAGAIGLMQLMPVLWGGRSKAEMQDPETNMRLGADFLRQLREGTNLKFGGLHDRLPEVASVYNCGAAEWTPAIVPKRPMGSSAYPWGLCENTQLLPSGERKNLGYISKVVATANDAMKGHLVGWPKASTPATSRKGSSGAGVVMLAIAALGIWYLQR
jgi:hypothetical protein